jgi:hypothetical protein
MPRLTLAPVRGFAIALNRGCSGQDPFVIAIAMVKSGTVGTGRNRWQHRHAENSRCLRRPRRALPDPDEVHRSPGVDVLSVCGCGGSHTRSAACQELAKTGTNRMDRATQTGHADFADLDVRDAAEH